MKLDSEEQRQLIIALIRTARITGNLEEAEQTIRVLNDLLEKVQKAEVVKDEKSK